MNQNIIYLFQKTFVAFWPSGNTNNLKVVFRERGSDSSVNIVTRLWARC
jgi:hypothetical protein